MIIKILKNENGVSMITVMMAVMGIVALSLVVTHQSSLRRQQVNKSHADLDVDLAVNKISAELNAPQHCNAIFRNAGISSVAYVPKSDSPPTLENTGPTIGTNLKTCSSSACTSTTGTNTYAVGGTSWLISATGFPAANTNVAVAQRVSRIRIKSANVSIDKSPQPAPSGDPRPWTARLTLVFEKNMGRLKNDNTPLVTEEKRYVFFPVTLSSKSAPISSTTISGCPKSSANTYLP